MKDEGNNSQGGDPKNSQNGGQGGGNYRSSGGSGSGGYRGNNNRHYNQYRGGPRQDLSKEWKLIQDLLSQSHLEQKKTRRWGVFFKSLGFIYFFLVLWLFASPLSSGASKSELHTALIDVNGVIMANEGANADAILSAVKSAFLEKNAKGIILRVNSPGGSPVESGIIYDEIKRYRSLYPNKKVYAVITETGASGAYYIAIATDGIYANPASIVGSIGVVAPGFGFSGLIDKLGVERRVFSSGENKAMLDPFSPLKNEEAKYFEGLLTVVHRQFIDRVKESRGERLKSQDVFSGLFWTGEQALQLGIIDGLGSPNYVAREIIGAEKIIDYSESDDPLALFTRKMGVQLMHGMLSMLKTFSFSG